MWGIGGSVAQRIVLPVRVFGRAAGLVLACLIVGCEETTNDARGVAASVPASAEDSQADDYHDFGRVLDNADLVHEFVIENDSAQVWEIHSVKPNCGCAAAMPERDIINPGTSLTVPVRFRPGPDPGRVTKQVTINFKQGIGARVLTVSAEVRAELTVFPEDWQAVLIPGQRASASLTIENYSARDWVDVTVSPHTLDGESPWLSVNVTPVPALAEPGAPRQRWLATVVIDGTQLLPGRYAANIDVVAQPPNHRELRTTASLEIELCPKVRVIPPRLVVVRSRGEFCTKTMQFRFAHEDQAPLAKTIGITHDLPFDVAFECAAIEGGVSKATMTIGPLTGDRGTVRGEVLVEFGDPLFDGVRVPVVVVDRPDESGN